MLFFNNKKEHHVPEMKPTGSHVFNLIILDRSGSMCVIEKAARSGCNEVLSGIRKEQKDTPELIQHITLLPFSTGKMTYIYDDVAADQIKEIGDEYSPAGGTALYDAMGFALSALERKAEKYDDAVGVVTIITDGEENSSREFTGKMIFDLVERLKKKGWTFAFMGANQDVLKVASSLNIKNARAFDYDNAGMADAFQAEASARHAFFQRHLKNTAAAKGMSAKEKQNLYAEAEENTNYYGDQA